MAARQAAGAADDDDVRQAAFKHTLEASGLSGVIVSAVTGLFSLRPSLAPADAAPCLALGVLAAECDAVVRAARRDDAPAAPAAAAAGAVRVPEAPSWLPLVYAARGGFVGLESLMAWADADGLATAASLARGHAGVWLAGHDAQQATGVEVRLRARRGAPCDTSCVPPPPPRPR